MKKSNKFLLVIFVVILCAGLVYKFIITKTNEFDFVVPKKGTIVEAVYGIGTVTGKNTFNLRVGVNAGVKELFVNEGDVVSKNTSLIRFDDGQIWKAPFEGTVTGINYKVGENVSPQTVVLTLLDLKNLYVSVSLEQQGALRVEKNQLVEMSFENLRGQKAIGKVRSIFPQNGQFIVHIDSSELAKEILPGMTADIAIAVGKKENALLIPSAALIAGKVLVKRNSKKMKIDVKIGIIDGSWAEIVDESILSNDMILVPKK